MNSLFLHSVYYGIGQLIGACIGLVVLIVYQIRQVIREKQEFKSKNWWEE